MKDDTENRIEVLKSAAMKCVGIDDIKEMKMICNFLEKQENSSEDDKEIYQLFNSICSDVSEVHTSKEEDVKAHQQMVKCLVKDGATIKEELTPLDAHLMHMVIGISGEAGELLDAVKKSIIYRKELDLENVIEELGDLEFFMEGLRQSLGLTREECLKANMEKLALRYGNYKYTDESAVNRLDKES